jgi:hypothetical protein
LQLVALGVIAVLDGDVCGGVREGGELEDLSKLLVRVWFCSLSCTNDPRQFCLPVVVFD